MASPAASATWRTSWSDRTRGRSSACTGTCSGARGRTSGGVSHKAIAGVELALWDIKAKALGVPVYELFGGPLRDRVRLYWSHCGTTRARLGRLLGHAAPRAPTTTSPRSAREVVARGFTALKTNIVIPGEPATVYFPGFSQRASTPRTARPPRTSWTPPSASSAPFARRWVRGSACAWT